jgi:hypothetical protein
MPVGARRFPEKNATINRGWQEEDNRDHGVDKARRKHAQRGGGGKDCCKSNNEDRVKGHG